MSDEGETASALPKIPHLLLAHPLYELVPLEEHNRAGYLRNLDQFNGALDCYCPTCDRPSTFQRHPPPAALPAFAGTGGTSSSRPDRRLGHLLTVGFRCARDPHHTLDFTFVVVREGLVKMGQYPSLADLASGKLDKYQRILTKNDFRELKCGVGLAAHGIGIGAFVYLRRIIERLIGGANVEARAAGRGMTDEDWRGRRMDERIRALQDFLPSFLVRNTVLYGVLSKGIHELEEDECRTAFPAVQACIEIILDERIAKREQEEKQAEAAKSLNQLQQHMRNEKPD